MEGNLNLKSLCSSFGKEFSIELKNLHLSKQKNNFLLFNFLEPIEKYLKINTTDGNCMIQSNNLNEWD